MLKKNDTKAGVGPLPKDNLGTPDGYDKKNMYKYLREFLSDSRVIEWPKALWYPILYGIVLNVRPAKSGAAYESIWNHEQNESPLRLKEQGCDRIVIFPLYPQYSAATTATVNDKVFDHLMKQRWMPAIRTIPAYHDEPVYIDALAPTNLFPISLRP